MLFEMLSQYAEEYSEGRVSDDIFRRSFDKPLYEFCADVLQSLSIIPGLKLESWEIIEDQSKLKVELNRKIIKEKKILKNEAIKKLVPIDKTDLDLLKATFSYSERGKEIFRKDVEVFILHEDEFGYFLVNGRKQLPLLQIVDRNTFVKDDDLVFKTQRWGIKISSVKRNVKLVEGRLIGRSFMIDLFTKKFQVLLYYLAQYGFEETIKYFYLEDAITITTQANDHKHYLYYEIDGKDTISYLALDKNYVRNKQAVDFFVTLIDCIEEEQSLGEIAQDRKQKTAMPVKTSNVVSHKYWKERLAYQFHKRDAKRSRAILISFERALDINTRNTTPGMPKEHMRDIYSLVRCLMMDFDIHYKKDNYDVENRRVRCKECLSHYFDQFITNNVNSLLSGNSISPDRIKALLRGINHNTFLKAISKYDLWRHERCNDYDAINLSRYTQAGPAGINGGKYKTAMAARIIYPSHLGVFDISTSTSNPGVTGFMCINLHLNEMGAFSAKMDDTKFVKRLISIKPYRDNLYKRTKASVKVLSTINKNNMVVIERRKSLGDKFREKMEHLKDSHLVHDNTIYVFRRDLMNKEGQIEINSKDEIYRDKRYEYDNDGRIIIEMKKTPEEAEAIYTRNRQKTRRRKG